MSNRELFAAPTCRRSAATSDRRGSVSPSDRRGSVISSDRRLLAGASVRRRFAAAAAIAALGVLAAGCSSSGSATSPQPARSPVEVLPAPDAFRAGTCRSAAEEVRWLAHLAQRNVDTDSLSTADRTGLVERQRALMALSPSAETDVRKSLTDLTTSIGFVRITSDTHSYRPQRMRDLDQARRNLQAACVR